MKTYILIYKHRGRNGYGGTNFSSSSAGAAIRKAENYCAVSCARPFLLFEQRYTATVNIKEWKLR